MFDGMTVRDARRYESLLRRDGYCGRVGPFGQGAHNRVVSWCAATIGECARHDYSRAPRRAHGTTENGD